MNKRINETGKGKTKTTNFDEKIASGSSSKTASTFGGTYSSSFSPSKQALNTLKLVFKQKPTQFKW